LQRCDSRLKVARQVRSRGDSERIAPTIAEEGVVILSGPQIDPSALRVQLQPHPGDGRRSLQRQVITALEDGVQRVVVDCDGWVELDLMLLSSLVACASACHEIGAEFELENLCPTLRSSIESLHVASRLGLADEPAATLA
jgi:anti-anti-sigma regulatory factor